MYTQLYNLQDINVLPTYSSFSRDFLQSALPSCSVCMYVRRCTCVLRWPAHYGYLAGSSCEAAVCMHLCLSQFIYYLCRSWEATRTTANLSRNCNTKSSNWLVREQRSASSCRPDTTRVNYMYMYNYTCKFQPVSKRTASFKTGQIANRVAIRFAAISCCYSTYLSEVSVPDGRAAVNQWH